MLFVGDIHGDLKLLEKIISKYGNQDLHFIGDYVDSYSNSLEDQAKCFEIIYKRILKGESDGLLGNHELSYLHEKMRASGYNYELYPHCQKLYNLHSSFPEIHPFKSHIYYPEHKLLITHAGLSNWIWKVFVKDSENLGLVLTEWQKDIDSPAYYIGRCRGGKQKTGGIYWCDFNKEFEPIMGLNQVFGHTPVKKIESFNFFPGTKNPEQFSNNYNIDCLEYGKKQLLEYKENQFRIIDI